jgi:hypothetical protein
LRFPRVGDLNLDRVAAADQTTAAAWAPLCRREERGVLRIQ